MAKPLGVNPAEVLKLREKGLTIGEIAQRLGCSKVAVRYHLDPEYRVKLSDLMRKFSTVTLDQD
jgi:DNA-binding NarL/FixJ family response regulator